MNVPNDIALFSAIKTGEKAAFDKMFLKYYPVLCAYSRQFVPAAEGEDIVQGIMVYIWEKRRAISLSTSLHSYLFTSVRNKCLSSQSSSQRKNRIFDTIYENVLNDSETPEYYDLDSLSARIEHAIGALPETYRQAFVMNRYEGKTYQQIADELGISPKTVDYRICQSLRILRRELKEYLPLFLVLLEIHLRLRM